MSASESLQEYVWNRVGAECRELVRESLRLIDQFDPEERPKLLACFWWVNWCRGRADYREGREKIWEME